MTYQSAGTPYDNTEDVDSTGTLSSNVWHHVVGTFEPSTAGKIYIDGSLDTSNTVSVPASIFGSTADVYISGIDGASPPSNCVDGDIQNVRIYNRALSAAEISRLYQDPWAGTDRAIEPSPTVKDLDTSSSLITNLVGWWPLTEFGPQDTLAYDISGNGNHGVASGGVQRQFTDTVRAATFDGVDSYLEGNNDLSVFESQVGTVSIWFKLDSSALDNPGDILLQIADGSAATNRMSVVAGRVGSSVPGSSIAASFTWGGTTSLLGCYDNGAHFVFDDTWHHFAYVVGSASNAMYLDGVEVTQTYYGGLGTSTTGNCFCNPTTSLDGVRFGARKISGAYSSYAQGNIQNVRVYSRALSAAEIQTLYDDPWVGLATDSLVYAYYSAAFLQRLG